MRIIVLTCLCVLYAIVGYSQKHSLTYEEARKVFETIPTDSLSKISVYEVEDTLKYNYLLRFKPGEIITYDNATYKISGKKTLYLQHCGKITIDPKLSLKEINRIEKVIIEKYKQGELFENLINQYSIIKDAGEANTIITINGWVPEREKAFKKHEKDKIFALNVPSLNSYQIILKREPMFSEKVVEVYIPEHKSLYYRL